MLVALTSSTPVNTEARCSGASWSGTVPGLSREVSTMKVKQNQSQAAMIRALLAKKVPVEKIVERVKKACGGEPTVGYVNWIAKRAKA
jgi:hypothetical protein